MLKKVFVAIGMSALIASLAPVPSAFAAPLEVDTYLDFNGTSQYAVGGNSTSLRTFNAITIEFWIMPQVASCVGNIVAKNFDYAVYCNSGTLSYAFAGTSTSWVGVATSIEMTANEWHHIAISRPASTATAYVYVDGQLHYTGTADGAGTAAIKSSANSYLNIGARGETATFFNGLVDEVRIFNTTRTAAQIVSDMHTWGNLGLASVVGYYDFNNITGSSLINKATSPDTNSDLTLIGSPTSGRIDSSTVSSDQTIVTFKRSYLNSNGGWFPNTAVTRYRALVIAGGGGGGNDEGGGGGAGGMIDSATVYVQANSPLTIDVGQGGKGANGTVGAYGDDVSRGGNGQDSIFASVTSTGGGGGGSATNTANEATRNGASGGSGGGGAGENVAGHLAGSGIAGQGFGGGAGVASGFGGGGGGASEAGNTNGGTTGGDGASSDITGSSATYAGGGGGGGGNSMSGTYAGGSGGGGNGGSLSVAPTEATANTGSGGGGGSGVVGGTSNIQYSGSRGAAGIIIIRYVTTGTSTLSGFSFSTTPTKSTNTTITLIMNVPGRMQFTIGTTRIKNCLTKTATGAGSTYTVTCVWKPAIHGPQNLKITVTPTNPLYAPSTYQAAVTVLRRTGNR